MTLSPDTARASRVRAVLAATVEALIDGGYSTLTVDRIATLAHASKATIYKSWPTKIDLVCAVATGTSHQPVPVPDPGLDLTSAVSALAEAVRKVTLGNDGRLLLALHEASRAEPQIAQAVDEHLVIPQQAAIAAALRTLQDQNRIAAAVDPALGGQIFASLIIDRALVSGEPVTDSELRRIVEQWLIPALEVQHTGEPTSGPSAGPG